jgi:integrase
MAPKKSGGKIAAFVEKYSNKGTGISYRAAIEGFLRCMFGLLKVGTDGKKENHDYESLFASYLADKKRDKIADITAYSNCLIRESVSKQSARQQLTYAVKFLRAHGVNIMKDDIQDLKRECKGGAATIDKVMDHAIICKALKGSDIRSRALILVLASSGLRIGELLSLSMSDIDLSATPVMITVRAENSKNGQSRYTFITSEAKDALVDYLGVRDEYIERADKHAKVLGAAPRKKITSDTDEKKKVYETKLVFPISDGSVNKLWETLLRNAGLFTQDEVSGRNQYRIHSLRKFFISQLSLAGARTLAEHLAGHTGYLDASYRQVSPEFSAREYLKLQSVLTVCIPESIKNGIKLADEKISILMEKTDLQSESVEAMKIINAQLREQMKTQATTMIGLQEQVNEISRLLTAQYNERRENLTPSARRQEDEMIEEGKKIAKDFKDQKPDGSIDKAIAEYEISETKAGRYPRKK